MDRECYESGQCKMCGCATTALQMCDKACDKPCYPEMMDKKTWNELKKNPSSPFKYPLGDRQLWILDAKENKVIKYER